MGKNETSGKIHDGDQGKGGKVPKAPSDIVEETNRTQKLNEENKEK